MSLTIGKRDVARMADVIDRDFTSAEEAAKAALVEAFAIYESKARFTVVGQLSFSGGYIDHDDAAASKVALGRYGTQKQGQAAAESLVFGNRTHEEFRAWVLPVWHGTPAAFYADRADERKKIEAAKKTPREAALIRRQEWFKANPGALILPDHIDDETARCASCGHELTEVQA